MMKILWIHAGHAPGSPTPARLKGLAYNLELICSDNPEDALELCAVHSPELVVISGSALYQSGLHCVSGIKRTFQSVKVCVMIDTKDNALVKATEAAGADIITPEGISPDELIQLFKYSELHYRVFPASDS
ncbi:MAG: response regulator transcription factor [Clostridiales bacterium]|nr:response regulator transcription factor [Clostridiales bacterium]